MMRRQISDGGQMPFLAPLATPLIITKVDMESVCIQFLLL